MVDTIRDEFASHYERKPLADLLGEMPGTGELHLISTDQNLNQLYSFAETIRNIALIGRTASVGGETVVSWDNDTARKWIRKLYGESHRIAGKLSRLTEDLLPLILKQCNFRRTEFVTTAITEPEKSESIIFVDEDAISRSLETQA